VRANRSGGLDQTTKTIYTHSGSNDAVWPKDVSFGVSFSSNFVQGSTISKLRFSNLRINPDLLAKSITSENVYMVIDRRKLSAADLCRIEVMISNGDVICDLARLQAVELVIMPLSTVDKFLERTRVSPKDINNPKGR
jgi:hypothetical protein